MEETKEKPHIAIGSRIRMIRRPAMFLIILIECTPLAQIQIGQYVLVTLIASFLVAQIAFLISFDQVVDRKTQDAQTRQQEHRQQGIQQKEPFLI